MDLKNTEEIFVANKFGHILNEVMKGGGDQYNTSFFKSLRLQIGDNKLDSPYKQHVWTYACLNAKATAFKGVPFLIVKERKKSGAERKTFNIKSELRAIRSFPLHLRHKLTADAMVQKGFDIVEDGPMYDLFAKPNPYMTMGQLWESLAIFTGLGGESFWLLDGGADGAVSEKEFPKEISPFGPDFFKPIIDNNGALAGWLRPGSGQIAEKKFLPHQVLWFYKFNPYEKFGGLGPMEVVRRAASQDLKAQVFNEAIFDNGGFPGGFLRIDGTITDETKRRALITEFNDRHQGSGKAGKWGLLQNKAEVVFNPNNHNDMQFLDGRKWNRDETFAAFGVPKMKGSIYEDLQLATALVAVRSFWEDNIIPELHYIEDRINTRLFNNPNTPDTMGYYCVFDLSGVEALRSDLKDKSEVAERLCRVGATWNQVNERLQLGFEKVAWGDVWWPTMSMTPVDSAEKPEGDEEKEDDKLDDSDYKDDGKSIIQAPAILRVERALDKIHKQKVYDMWIERVFKPIEKPFSSKMRAYWWELRKEQLEKWESATKSIVRAIPTEQELEDILFNNSKWQERIKAVTRPFVTSAAQYSLKQITDEIGVAGWSIEDPRISAVLQSKANKIVGIPDRFWKFLKEQLTDGIRASENVTQLSDRIKQAFNGVASPSRTLTIARTETAQTASTVRNIAMRSEGVKQKEWSDSADEHVRGDHIALGQTGPQSLDHNYMTDLKRTDGKLMHPSDMGGPADQVINCRCLELPVL